MTRSLSSLFIGFAALVLTPACGMPPCDKGDTSCEQQMVAPPNGGGMVTSCTDSSQCLNGQTCTASKCVANSNPSPDMGGGNNNLPPGTCPTTTFTVKAYWANGRGSGAYMTGSYASATPTWGQVQNNPSDGNGYWTMCIPRTVQGYAITPCGYLDRHVQQIGSGPGQTNDDIKIGWCGGNASCKPDRVWIDGLEVPAATLANWNFVQGRGWPFVLLAGTGSICSTNG